MRRRAVENIAALDGPPGQRKIHILAEIGKLRRLCCHPALIDPKTPLESAKLAAFLELTDELLRNRHKALVFSQFLGHLEKVREALNARGVRYQLYRRQCFGAGAGGTRGGFSRRARATCSLSASRRAATGSI